MLLFFLEGKTIQLSVSVPLEQIQKSFNIERISRLNNLGTIVAPFFMMGTAERALEGKETVTAMDINQGEVFKNSSDGVRFIVKKIVRDLVVLESQDGKRQILTGTNTLTSTSSIFQRVEGGES